MYLMHWITNRRERVDGLSAVYWNTFFRSLSMGLLGIFVPVYIFTLALAESDSWVMGVRSVMIFVILIRLVVVFAAIPAAKFIGKYGFRWSTFVATVFHVLALMMLMLMKERQEWMLVAVFLFGLEVVFYWLPRLSMNVEDGHKESIGKEIGMRNLINRGVSVFGPFVGGVMIVTWGFEALFGVGVVLLLMSVVPLFLMPHHVREDGVNWRSFFEFVRSKENRESVASFVGHAGGDLVVGWVWPVFVFVVVGGFSQLGMVTSAVMVVSMLGVWLAGRIFDIQRAKGGNEDEKVFVWGVWVTVIMRFVRGFAGSVWWVFGLDSMHRLVSPNFWIPYWGYAYTAAERVGPLRFFAYREMIYSTMLIVMGGITMLLIGAPFGWQLVFGVSSLLTLLVLPVRRESNR